MSDAQSDPNQAGKKPEEYTKPEKAKGSEALSSLLNLIPNVYYDLIARVCPGMALLVALLAKQALEHQQEISKFASGPSLVVLVALSYVTGMALTGIAFLWDWLSVQVLGWLGQLPLLGATYPTDGGFWKKWHAYTQCMDDASKVSEPAGRTLGKMMAEVALCQNLLTGAVVFAVVGHWSCSDGCYDPTHTGWLYAAVIALLVVAMTYRQGVFLGRIGTLRRALLPPDA